MTVNSMWVIRGQIATEKSYLPEHYVFDVDLNADKSSIKKEVEALYKVKVTSVRTLRKKPERLANNQRRKGATTKASKKAYIRLAEGYSIEEDTDY